MPRGTKLRNVRVPDAIWDAAKDKAAAEETTVTAVVLEALERYITTPPR